MTKEHSNGATASYYELPAGAAQLQDLISHRDMNAQIGEIFRACYRYGLVSHSDRLRDARKILFYAQAEVERLEKLQEGSSAAVEPAEEPAQPVKKGCPVELAVGQVWKDRMGREVRIVGIDKDDSARPFEGCNGFYYTPYGGMFPDRVGDDGDLIELIQDEHGWRPWKATKDSVCPVGLGVRVRIKTAVGAEFTNVAQEIRWNAARNLGGLFSVMSSPTKSSKRPSNEPSPLRLLPLRRCRLRRG